MIRAYDIAARRLTETPPIPGEGWLDVDDPSEADMARLTELNIPRELVAHALDVHGFPRTLQRGAATLVVIRFSTTAPDGARMPYAAVPLGILLIDQRVVTVGRGHAELVSTAATRHPPHTNLNRFILAVFATIAERFLVHLEKINNRVNTLEEKLQKSQNNREVMALLHLQRSLMTFATSLEMNEEALAKVRDNLLGDAAEDTEILEDAFVELRQAKHVAIASNNLLSEMMDAFASIISNNLAVVVKLLSAIAVVLLIPTIIGTFYGMNVELPLAEQPAAFWIIVAASTALSALAAVWFGRRRWL